VINFVVGYCCRSCLVGLIGSVGGVCVIVAVVVMCVLSVYVGGIDVASVYYGVGIAPYDVDYDDGVVYRCCVVTVDNNAGVVAIYDIGVIDTTVVVVVVCVLTLLFFNVYDVVVYVSGDGVYVVVYDVVVVREVVVVSVDCVAC